MTRRGWLVLGICVTLAAWTLRAEETVPARITGAALTRGGAIAFLETLTDTIGGRVTGSPESRAASELILAALKEAGFENAHFEEYPLEARWRRGPATARIVSPIARPILIGSMGWVPGTAGEITASLRDAGAPASRDWKPANDVRGAVVIVDPQQVGEDGPIVMRALIAQRLAAAGAAAMLIPSDKPGRMLYTSAFGFYPKGPLPVISIAREDSLLLRRLLAKGPVTIALDVRNTFDTSPYRERNVVADLPGDALKDEVVLMGAHFDSWDPAQGANDDGAGVASVLEAARILKSLGVKPRRTIRFAFFSGEEQACLGSRAYVAAHEHELDRLKTVLITDEGPQAPLGFQLQGRADLEANARKTLTSLAPLGAARVWLDASFDEDHAPFVVAGVPALTLRVEPGEYDIHHHAISDTFDKVDPRLLAIDTAVMGVAAWSFADSPNPVGRRLSDAEADAVMKASGVASTRQMLYGSSRR
ncbi:MAG TPA: M20/M25/M40 family metallo-hydrolase [Vicinamibacterales bacterium]|jgi:Iap family predicted aminopeptidase